MGMSFHVVAIKAPDEKWKKMKKAYDACVDAGIDIPDEVYQFFNHETPDDKGVVIEIEQVKAITKELSEEYHDGFIIDVKSLLHIYPDVTHLKFRISY